MNNFKKLALVTSIALASITFANTADAAAYRCTWHNGIRVCWYDNGNRYHVYHNGYGNRYHMYERYGYNNCYWTQGHWRHGYWYRGYRVCR